MEQVRTALTEALIDVDALDGELERLPAGSYDSDLVRSLRLRIVTAIVGVDAAIVGVDVG